MRTDLESRATPPERLAKSDVFCILPWLHMHVAPDGRVLPCCACANWDRPFGSLRSATLAQLWNSAGIRRMRLNMLRGEGSPECRYCYRLEAGSGPSLRREVNERFRHRMAWTGETRPDGGLERLRMSLMDVRFSNLCNFRCRICGPGSSSGCYEDVRKLWGTPAHPKILTPMENPDELWRQIEPLLPDLEEIYFAGGEPLLQDEHYRMLDLLIARRLFEVKISYSTNFSVMEYRGRDVMALWDKFKTVNVLASLDGMGERGEYLRSGMQWEQALRNRRRMLQVCPRAEFFVAPVLWIMNSLHLPDFHKEWLDQGLVNPGHWKFQMLLAPEEYCIQALPQALKRRVAERYERHIERLLGVLGAGEDDARCYRSALTFMMARDESARLPRFRERTRQLDELRDERFAATFPELASLMSAYNDQEYDPPFKPIYLLRPAYLSKRIRQIRSLAELRWKLKNLFVLLWEIVTCRYHDPPQ